MMNNFVTKLKNYMQQMTDSFDVANSQLGQSVSMFISKVRQNFLCHLFMSLVWSLIITF